MLAGLILAILGIASAKLNGWLSAGLIVAGLFLMTLAVMSVDVTTLVQ